MKNQESYNRNHDIISGLKEDIAECDKRIKKINKGYIDEVYTDDEARELKLDETKKKLQFEKQIAMLEGENLNL